jgi:hypothetical protein
MTRRASFRPSVLMAALAISSLAFALCVHPVRAQAPEPDAKVIERPEWSVGDWWEFREKESTVWRLTVVGKENGGQYVLARTKPGESASDTVGKTKLYADRDGWITKTVQADGRTTDLGDKREYAQFPLTVGKRWFFNVDTKSTSGVPTAYSYNCQVDKWETIEVGRRQARALRISCSSTNRSTNSIESERIVAFLDACYSGAAGGRTFVAKKTRSGQVDDLFLERLTRSKGRAIVTASRPSEVSMELPELGHGVFTYYLVQGLQGRGRPEPRWYRDPPGAIRVSSMWSSR